VNSYTRQRELICDTPRDNERLLSRPTLPSAQPDPVQRAVFR
jgi:hypothetical protein